MEFKTWTSDIKNEDALMVLGAYTGERVGINFVYVGTRKGHTKGELEIVSRTGFRRHLVTDDPYLIAVLRKLKRKFVLPMDVIVTVDFIPCNARKR